ncbi:site-specific integrase [Curtobacterium sp. MCSS17_015]|uniref:tyrosine-type recombinase/integrase n=1 Tax=Curtobacterium sp. MCSS17_015 TaxID=2175666 RepID=UPI000DAAC7A7|nr:site-specific integrase [Curtobacterium sp. MCSS17_015]WIB25781.1 tyrosine-type recombinase/integrase [Curtobacterium sp. MCSS17_015]
MASFEKYEIAAGIRWRVRYRDPQNRSREKGSFKTLRAAKDFAATVEVSMLRGEYIDAQSSRMKIGDLATDWLATQTHLKPSSRRPIETAWRVHVAPSWGDVRVAQVRHSDVQRWVTDLAAHRSASVVLRAYGILASILDVAVKDRRISINAARGVNLPRKTTKAHVYLTHQQVHRLAANSGERRTLVLLLAYTGLRWEAIGLRVGDFDHSSRRLKVQVNAVEVGGEIHVGTPKSHKSRTIVLADFLLDALAAACGAKSRDALIFSDDEGRHLRRTRVSEGSRSWFKTALAESGLPPMTLHDLRHTAASLAVSAHGNVKAVQRMLGHASAAMTLDVYADLFADDLEVLADNIDAAARSSVVGNMWGSGLPEAV